MDQKIKFILLLTLSAACAGVLPLPKILEGPSSKTTLIGPDGSKISAFAPGGKIVLDENAGPVLQGAPEVVAVEGTALPLPVVQTEAVDKATPVVIADSKGDQETLAAEVVPVVETVKNGKAAETEKVVVEKVTGTETTTVAVSSIEELDSVEDENSSQAVEEATSPYVKHIAPVGSVELVETLNDFPLYLPEFDEYEEHEYVPENSFEREILGY